MSLTPDEIFDSNANDLPPVPDDVDSAITLAAASQEAEEPSTTDENEQSSESEGEPSETIEAVAETKPAVVVPKTKQVTFKVGDKAIALEEDAKIDWKVDGKVETIPLKDLISNYAGKIPIEKRFNELNQARKQDAARVTEFENTRTRHSTLIRDMHENVSKGKIFDAVANMLEMSGIKDDPQTFVQSMRNAMLEQAQQLSSMSPEERKLFEANERISFLQAKHDRFLKQRETEQTQTEFQGRVNKAIESVNSTLEEYVEMKKFLESDFQAKKRDVSLITPEFISERIKDTKDYTTARDALNEVSSDILKGSDKDKFWDQAVFLLRQNPTWTKDDLRDVFKQAIDQKRSSTVSKKIAKSPVAIVAAAEAKAKASPQNSKQKISAIRASQDPSAYAQLPADAFEW